jgi:hypothetical protein
MKKYLSIFVISLFLTACNDGDVILTSFNFGDANLEFCGGPGDYVFFKINNQAAESIALQLGTTEVLFFESDTLEVNLDGNANKVTYRSFDDIVMANYFCDNIPPTTPGVISNFIGTDGLATLFITAVFDDNDGIPFENSDDPLKEGFGDFDNDGLPNFYDDDDDGDNVPTFFEIGDDPENPMNTDGEDNVDYLDEDDDNDGVLTRYEVSGKNDLDPRDDITDPSVGPDYLNPAVANGIVVDAFRIHTYNVRTDVRVRIDNLVLVSESEQITREILSLGSIEDIVNSDITLTPDFPD